MEFALSVVAWLTAPEHWVGSDGIPNRVAEHLLISGATTAAAVLVALPAGLVFGHTGRGGFVSPFVVWSGTPDAKYPIRKAVDDSKFQAEGGETETENQSCA